MSGGGGARCCSSNGHVWWRCVGVCDGGRGGGPWRGCAGVRGGGARGCVGVHSVRTVQGFGFCLQQAARLSEGRAGTLGAPGRGAAATGVRPGGGGRQGEALVGAAAHWGEGARLSAGAAPPQALPSPSHGLGLGNFSECGDPPLCRATLRKRY